jgi:hypothetical protein
VDNEARLKRRGAWMARARERERENGERKGSGRR